MAIASLIEKCLGQKSVQKMSFDWGILNENKKRIVRKIQNDCCILRNIF